MTDEDKKDLEEMIRKTGEKYRQLVELEKELCIYFEKFQKEKNLSITDIHNLLSSILHSIESQNIKLKVARMMTEKLMDAKFGRNPEKAEEIMDAIFSDLTSRTKTNEETKEKQGREVRYNKEFLNLTKEQKLERMQTNLKNVMTKEHKFALIVGWNDCIKKNGVFGIFADLITEQQAIAIFKKALENMQEESKIK